MSDNITWPKRGDRFTHYKGDDYLVLSVGRNHKGKLVVVYCKYEDQHVADPEVFVQRLERFMQTLPSHEERFYYFNHRELMPIGAPRK